VWRFKRFIYATQTSTPIANVDVADPSVRRRLQRHFDEQGTLPRAGAADEYAEFFEAAYPAAADRRRILEEVVVSARPAYGQLALAALMLDGVAPAVWTTNFDRTIEDAVSALAGTTTALTTADLAEPRIATRALAESAFPLLVKLHGDFQSENLKNTTGELQAQDGELREVLVVACQRFGLVVAGYSGRDASVMEALNDAVERADAFSAGLYWVHRESDPPQGAPANLLERAAAKGIPVGWVQANTFDELMGEVLVPIELRAESIARLDAARPPARSSSFAVAPAGATWPVIRFNALRLVTYPTSCRRVECDIGGTREVRRAIAEAEGQIVAVRRRDGVVGFGPDAEFRRVFDPYGVRSFDAQPIVGRPGGSTDVGLLYEALVGGLSRERQLVSVRVRHQHLLAIHPAQSGDARFAGLRGVAGALTGTIPGTRLAWAEAVELSLEWHNGQPWLLFDPTVWADRPDSQAERNTRLTWLKGRTAGRYNRAWNALLESWSSILAAGGPCQLFGIPERHGIDATFELDPTTAFSRAAS